MDDRERRIRQENEQKQAALAEERRIRQENEQKQAAEMAQMYNYIRGLSVQMGNPIPAMQFPVAPAPTTPPVSILKTL